MGRLSTRLSSRACVSESIQCRSSKTSSSGCTWLSRSSTRLRASSVRWRRCGGSSVQERAVLRQGIQQRQQGRDGVLEGLVERQHLPGHLGADGARVVAVLDVAVALEQVEHREVGRGLAVGHRGALQHQPALGVVGVDELVDQARLAHAGLAHQRHHLACPAPARCQGLLQRLQLRSAARQSGVSPRATAACKRRRMALAPTSSNTSTGSASPLTGTGPRA